MPVQLGSDKQKQKTREQVEKFGGRIGGIW